MHISTYTETSSALENQGEIDFKFNLASLPDSQIHVYRGVPKINAVEYSRHIAGFNLGLVSR